jgi:hypothetical protein
MVVIKVPNSEGPKGICWKTHPSLLDARCMAHCMRKKGHRSRHDWETQEEYATRKATEKAAKR